MPRLEPHQSFVIEDAQRAGALIVKPTEKIPVEELLRGKVRLRKPVFFVRHLGRVACDLLPTAHAMLYLISEGFRSTLVENGFSGWNTYPVQAFDQDNHELSGYYGWSVTGKCGEVDSAKSTEADIVPKGCTQPIPMLKGLMFDPESWDGSDLFLSPRLGYKFCTTRVAAALRQKGLTNVKLTLASNHSRADFSKLLGETYVPERTTS
jgi:hypothetical protein